MKNKKRHGIESLKSRYGLLFISPWIIGTALFFITPLMQSVWFSFCDVSVTPGNVSAAFSGIGNYREVLVVDPDYFGLLQSVFTTFLYSMPITVILSLILAIMLNQEFRGRLFFRGLFFISAIIATGGVLEMISRATDINSSANVSESVAISMFTADDIMNFLDLPGGIGKYVASVVGNIFNLVWNCGIQTVLYISGLQTISGVLYEVADIEGANKWEQFWFITFPMLSKINLLVLVFTSIELFTDTRSSMIKHVYNLMLTGNYSTSSAKLWFYFLVVGGLLSLVILIYRQRLQKRWE